MRIAILIPDNRENFRKYDLKNPYFGTAPTALLQGFTMLNQGEMQKIGGQSSGGKEQGMVPPFEIHVISCTQQPMYAPEKLASNIWFHSVHVSKWGWLRTGYQGCVRAVRKKLKEIQPDLVHAQGTERDCALSAILSPYPRLLTIHGNLRLIKKQVGFKLFSAMWFQSFLEGFAVPRFDGVICITNYTREVVEHEVPKTWVVPNAVDPTFLELGEKRMGRRHGSDSVEINNSGFKSQVGLPGRCFASVTAGLDSPPVILVVANVNERKNQNAFLCALDPLAEKMSFKVRFFGGCGASDYAREFRELIESRPWCHYGGMLGREELRTQFEQATMLALPTHEDNCPMVVLEAMASGVAVMASKVGGVPDLIDGVRTGLFCDPCDPESFRAGVKRLLEDREYAHRMASAAHDDAMRRFHPNVIASKHLEIYREVLSVRVKINR
jgi:glycosyltransferase involved in cell wall biosynthesis